MSRTAIANMRRIREARGWASTRLSKELRARGLELTDHVIGNLEIRAGLTYMPIDLLFPLATVFDTTPTALVSAPICDHCSGAPPALFTCTVCGATGG